MRYLIFILIVLISSCYSVNSENKQYKVVIHGNQQCKYDYGDEDFCSTENLTYYQNVSKKINFDKDKILLAPEDKFGYIIVIDPNKNIVFPFEYLVDYDNLEFHSDSNNFCIDGTISAYRYEDSGHICFVFNGNNFERVFDSD